MVATVHKRLAAPSPSAAGKFAGIRARLPELRRAARQASRAPEDAEDLLQDALLELVRSGRMDLGCGGNMAWLLGVLRNLGAMQARTAVRRRTRDDLWSSTQPISQLPSWWSDDDRELRMVLDGLPLSLRRVAQLALSGHDRREIAWLLGLRDDTLRQRISALRQRLSSLERDLVGFALDAGPTASPSEENPLPWTIDLLRRALLPVVHFSQSLGVADPDGHLVALSGPRHRIFPTDAPHVPTPLGNIQADPSISTRANHHPERPSASPSPTRSLP